MSQRAKAKYVPSLPTVLGFVYPCHGRYQTQRPSSFGLVLLLCCYGPVFWVALAIGKKKKSNMKGVVPYQPHEWKLLLPTQKTQGMS